MLLQQRLGGMRLPQSMRRGDLDMSWSYYVNLGWLGEKSGLTLEEYIYFSADAHELSRDSWSDTRSPLCTLRCRRKLETTEK